MAFVGLVPSEHSSGVKRARGGITKTGNAHRRPRGTTAIIPSSATRCAPDNGVPPAAIIAQAWTAQQRLHRRYRRLAARGKPKQHIVTAVARELTGFVWAALTQPSDRPTVERRTLDASMR
jgi:transposase